MSELIKLVEALNEDRKQNYPDFAAGDTISVHVKIKEGNKERIQQFQGTVIQRRNPNTPGETFTVRKISDGVGVERLFPLFSPNIESIVVNKRGRVRRAKIYYQRERFGKSARIREKKQVTTTAK